MSFLSLQVLIIQSSSSVNSVTVWPSCLSSDNLQSLQNETRLIPDAGKDIKSRTGSTTPLLDHRLWNGQSVDEVLVVLRVAALVLVDFPLDLFGCVLVVVLLISGHRLQGGGNNGTVGLDQTKLCDMSGTRCKLLFKKLLSHYNHLSTKIKNLYKC